jgi:hypothetical protein
MGRIVTPSEWIFAGRPFIEGKPYRFKQLPLQTQNDAAAHFELEVGEQLEAQARYRFVVLSQEDLMEMLEGSYGPTLKRAMNDPYVKILEADIRRHGLRNPPVGGEGMHRLLALARIGKGAPYFHMEELP